jgi:hypothetical protein
MRISNFECEGFNVGKELFVVRLQSGMLIPKSASNVILVHLVDRDVSEECIVFIFSVHCETGDSTLFMIFVPTTS